MLGRLSHGATLLKMMRIIAVLLCVLINEVICQTKDILPAKILAHQKTVSENSDLHLTCSTFGRKKQSVTFVYLWKDGHAIKKITQKQDQNDITFSISRVGVHHSGNYSCVCSPENYTPSEIDQRGDNIIEILVIASFFPADISVVGSSTVHEGDHVEFLCRVSEILHTLGECQLILSHLRKNDTVLQLQAFNVTRMETTFSIKEAALRDSGHYSCIVLPTKCIEEQENALYGRNTVFLEVKVNMVLRAFVICGVTILMILLSLCVWISVKQAGHSVSCNPCVMSQQANADMLEEQQEQIEEVHLEAQDGEDSFSLEVEDEFQHSVTSDGSAYDDVGEGAYSLPDDFPARPNAAHVYASASKYKNH